MLINTPRAKRIAERKRAGRPVRGMEHIPAGAMPTPQKVMPVKHRSGMIQDIEAPTTRRKRRD